VTAEIKMLLRHQWEALDEVELRELIRLLDKARLAGSPENPLN
jgi:hypothetical protein